jgi:hypothetical protein
VWLDVLFAGLAVLAEAALFSSVLPRLASAPITEANTAHPTHPTLSGGRFGAWVAINACFSFALFWGYIAVARASGSEGRLYVICVAVSVIFFAFQGSAFRAHVGDPDARFGAFVGLIIGMVAVFLIAP